ncbi:RNA-binding protein [Trypanosoma brucei equiperdum]|uniref:RNA-binding protein n=1 Tax=Trypanosoma brucei equiperdum TaxID=630700 RepID=A0A3L6LAH0_9TRYP|nr:RNA-binding protein [Trypanosoma brucei equiperdum]
MSQEGVHPYSSQSNAAPLPICPTSPYEWDISSGTHDSAGEMMSLSISRESPPCPRRHGRRSDRTQPRGPFVKLPESKLTPNECQSKTNLIVRNLSNRVDEAVLKQIFSPYGEILSAAVMRNIHTGDSLGTAFVRFATTEQAQAALVGCHGRVVCGRVLSVQWAKRQHDGTPVGEARKKIVKLFIRNIPLDVGPEDVQRLFERFGTVESVSLHKDTAAATPTTDNSRPQRRIAFVTFTESGVADRAAEAVHNTRPFPSHGSVPLMVKLAEDHSERRLAAAAAVAGGGSGHNSRRRPENHQSNSTSSLTASCVGDMTPTISDAGRFSAASVHVAVPDSPEASLINNLPLPRGGVKQQSQPREAERSQLPLAAVLDISLLSCCSALAAEGLPHMSPETSSVSGSDRQWARCYVHDPYNPSRSRQYLDEK